MQMARIVVLTIAPGTGGVTAYPARGTDATSRPDAARQSGTRSLALRSIADANMVHNNTSEEESQKRDESVKVVRYGVQGATTIQK
jgi:Flp pilus assembly protein CpaB